MPSHSLTLPCVRVAVTAPADTDVTLHAFYPTMTPGEATGVVDRRYNIRQAEDEWRLTIDGSDAGRYPTPSQVLFALEYDLELLVVERSGQLIAFHAGAVVSNGSAVLVAGDSGAGKTTTTFNLIELGYEFLCEEVALVDPSTRLVHPHPQSLAVTREFLDRMDAEQTPVAGTIVPLDSRFARYVPHRIARAPATVDTVVLPRFDPGTSAGLETVSAADVLTEVLGYCFPPAEGEEELFDGVIRLLESCRVVRLCYADVTSARRLLRELCAVA